MNFAPVEPQRIFIDHMRKSPVAFGMVGVGIGKTASVLYRLCEMFQDMEATAALVLAPMRVSNLSWPQEAKDWDQFRWLKMANLRTESGKRAFLNGSAHIYHGNYEMIPEIVSLVERRKGTIPYDVVVYDESTKAKNPGSKRINLFRRKVPRVKYNIALTGTPAPNSNLDLFAQVRLIDGGERLGTSVTAFKQQYFYKNGMWEKWKEKNGAAAAIEQKISDITCTLKSSDWLDIPDTIVEDVEVPFTPELRDKYKKLERELVIELKSKTMNVPSSAALITKLLQFTSGHMYCDEKDVHPIHNLKFDALAKLAMSEKQNLLVAVIYKHEQDRIREQFPYAKFFSDAKGIQAQTQLLKDWNDKKIKMLVAHPASCGHGLNMQYGSSVLVYITLTYSREMYEQMIARLSRRGQTEVTKVYRLMVPGTVDDAVAEALASKADNEKRLIAALQMLESFRK